MSIKDVLFAALAVFAWGAVLFGSIWSIAYGFMFASSLTTSILWVMGGGGILLLCIVALFVALDELL